MKVKVVDQSAMRKELQSLIHQLDEGFLRAVYALISTYHQVGEQPIGYRPDDAPIFGSQLGEVLDEEVAGAERGNYISITQLEKQSQAWTQNTK